MTSTEAVRTLWPLFLVQFGLVIWSLFDIWRNRKTRLLPPGAWAIIVIIISIFGGVAYLLFGTSEDRDHE